MKKLSLRHGDQGALLKDYEENLRKGRAFVAAQDEFGEREVCELLLHHPTLDLELTLRAEAVWVGPLGVGLEFVNFDTDQKRRLAEFVNRAEDPKGLSSSEPSRDDDDPEGASARGHRNLHERVRAMSIRERDELARRGSLPERMALERAFGGAVWEGLLQNPQLTAPEIARIAKNGSLPRPLVATIANNAAWVSAPEVQRALLSNPRCTGPQLEKVLRAMKPADLRSLSQQCPYRPEVRAFALRLVGKA